MAFGPLKRFTRDEVVRITLGAAANLATDTPVDTGHASNNWIASIGSPATEVAGSHEAPDSGPQKEGLARVASEYQLPLPTYIANNVPYIGALNDGHSKQAPTGFVQAGVLRAVRTRGQG